MNCTKVLQLNSSRLLLLACNEEIFKAMLESNKTLSDLLQIEVPEHWADFGMEPYVWSLDQLKEDRENTNWLTYLTIHQEDQKMIGNCGYKGKPDGEGMVEIGYSILPEYRLQGFATECAQLLIQHAYAQPKVTKVQAHTLAEKNESASVLEKCGMEFVGALQDEEDGEIWQWVHKKSTK